MITRNFKEDGELITAGSQFVSGKDAIKIKLMRLVRMIKGEDFFDLTRGLDFKYTMQLAARSESLYARHITDYIQENMPEVRSVIYVKTNQDKQQLRVEIAVETAEGVIEI